MPIFSIPFCQFFAKHSINNSSFTNDTFNVAFWQDDECPSASFCARFPPPWAPIVGCQVSLDASRSVPVCDNAVDSSVPVNLIWGQENSISNADAEAGVLTGLEAARADDTLALHPFAKATEPQADPQTGTVPVVSWHDQWPQSTLLYSIDTQRVSSLRGSVTVMSRGSYVCTFFRDPELLDPIVTHTFPAPLDMPFGLTAPADEDGHTLAGLPGGQTYVRCLFSLYVPAEDEYYITIESDTHDVDLWVNEQQQIASENNQRTNMHSSPPILLIKIKMLNFIKICLYRTQDSHYQNRICMLVK